MQSDDVLELLITGVCSQELCRARCRSAGWTLSSVTLNMRIRAFRQAAEVQSELSSAGRTVALKLGEPFESLIPQDMVEDATLAYHKQVLLSSRPRAHRCHMVVSAQPTVPRSITDLVLVVPNSSP